jgi:hypothetical protein
MSRASWGWFGPVLRRLGPLLVALLWHPMIGRAAEPVALVESISGTQPGVELMDYLAAGQVISLTSDNGLVIDYLRSCIRETIKGGTVTVGTERSAIKGGSVERERVRCDGRQLNLSPEQSQASAGTVTRVEKKAHPLPAGVVIERHIYGASPIFDLGGEHALAIERLDRAEDRLDLQIPADRLVRGRFYDSATDGKSLSPGGTYRATIGQHSVVFQIDRSAKSGITPVVGRLLQIW